MSSAWPACLAMLLAVVGVNAVLDTCKPPPPPIGNSALNCTSDDVCPKVANRQGSMVSFAGIFGITPDQVDGNKLNGCCLGHRCGTVDQCQDLTIMGFAFFNFFMGLFAAVVCLCGGCFVLYRRLHWWRHAALVTVVAQEDGDTPEDGNGAQRSATPVSWGVYAILMTQTLDAFVNTIVMPTMPYYAMNCLGATAIDLAMFGSAQAFSSMLCSPLFGITSDKVGRKKILLASLFLQAMCNYYQSTCTNVWSLTLARALVGIAMGSGPVEMAYILDHVDSENLDELNHVLALQKIVCSCGAFAGPAVATFFTANQFPLLCYGLVGVNVCNFIIGSMLWKDAPKEEENGEEDSEEERDTVEGALKVKKPEDVRSASVFNRTTITLLMVSVVNTGAFCISDAIGPIYFKNYFGFGVRNQANYYMVLQGATLLLTPLAPLILGKLGNQLACIIGALVSSVIVMNMVLYTGQAWVPYVHAIAFQGFIGTIMGFGYIGILQKKLSSNLMGTFFGISNSMNSVGGMVAPLAGAAIYSYGQVPGEAGKSNLPWRTLPYEFTACGYLAVAGLYASLMWAKDKDADEEEDEKLEHLLPQRSRAKTGMNSLISATSLAKMGMVGTRLNVAVNLINQDLELYAAHKRLNVYQRAGPRIPRGLPVAATAAGGLQSLAQQPQQMGSKVRSFGDFTTHIKRKNTGSYGDLAAASGSQSVDVRRRTASRVFIS